MEVINHLSDESGLVADLDKLSFFLAGIGEVTQGYRAVQVSL